MTRSIIKITCFLLATASFLTGCKKDFDEYYREPETANLKLLEVIRTIPEYSIFVNYLEQLQLDTLFSKNQSYTLFIPDNAAFESENLSVQEISRVMTYSFTQSVILPSQIKDYKKIQAYSGKFSIIERNEDGLLRDGMPVFHNNPLYMDGTYYSLHSVLKPRPNLYEFLRDTCPVLADYIDEKDSTAFDPVASKPVGFDPVGNTIYDSVFQLVNTFERDFFPVSVEARSNTATLVVCNKTQYTEALDRMALNLGPGYTDHSDIPEEWQKDVLIPYIFENGTFIGALAYDEFKYPLVRNILGDSIRLDYLKINEDSRYVCSNGVTFTYNQFDVPSKLYIDTIRFEGEKLTVAIGSQFTWAEGVSTNNSLMNPVVISSTEASGGKYLSVPLPRGYSTQYYVEFFFPKVFPNTYKFLWRANYRPSGLIGVYVNDVRIGLIDNYSFRNLVDGSRPSVQGFNQKIWSNINVTEYGDLRIRFEYSAAGSGTSNGLNIDYVALFPVN